MLKNMILQLLPTVILILKIQLLRIETENSIDITDNFYGWSLFSFI